MEPVSVDLSGYVGLQEFIKRSGYHPTTVHRWIDAGAIESVLILNARLIPLTELERIQTQGSPRRGKRKSA